MSGVHSSEIEKNEYYKYSTYATANLNKNLINIAGINNKIIIYLYKQ